MRTMRNLWKQKWLQVLIGVAMSGIFLYLAFSRINFHELTNAFQGIHGSFLLLSLICILVNDALRALRWRILLLPLKKLPFKTLFSAMMIGYAVNMMLPLRMGEVARALLLKKKARISGSSVFATVVTERVLDVLPLLLMVFVAVFIIPLPEWLKKSAGILFGITAIMVCILILLRRKLHVTDRIVERLLGRIAPAWVQPTKSIFSSFFKGFASPGERAHYFMILGLTLLIWTFVSLAVYNCMLAFNFHLPWYAPVILLIFISIGVTVPSPGYIGTFHWVCQAGLMSFGIAREPALAFAVVMHILNILPYLVLGLTFAWLEGVNVLKPEPGNKMPL
jgi:uncharacterized protein (TIRG00374 family)